MSDYLFCANYQKQSGINDYFKWWEFSHSATTLPQLSRQKGE